MKELKQEELFPDQERMFARVKDYKNLYLLYWHKYKILEDYVKDLEDRFKEEVYEFDIISEQEKLEEELLKARYFELE